MSDHVATKQLRLRVSTDLVEEVRGLAFRLPGQPPRRGYRDYQARPLTDAVMTAIAFERAYEDPFLSGLVPMLRHGSARGIWHLAVAATLTHAERRAYANAVSNPACERAVAVADSLRYDEEAWHHPWRVQLVRHIARLMLTGPEADANEKMLREQLHDSLWAQYSSDLENATDRDHVLLEDLPEDGSQGAWEGRGGTAVWRAKRHAALSEIPRWLAGGAKAPLTMSPPGWTLTQPCGWGRLLFPMASELPAPWVDHVTESRVLELEFGSKRVIWPVTPTGAPVGRVDIALRGRSRRSPEQLVEALLVCCDTEHMGAVRVPPHRAVEFGLLSPAQADSVVTAAQERTQRAMRLTIEGSPRTLEAGVVTELESAMNSPSQFARLSARYNLRFHVHDSRWPWLVESLAGAVLDNVVVEGLDWLGKEILHVHQRSLEASQQEAWHQAFALGRGRYNS